MYRRTLVAAAALVSLLFVHAAAAQQPTNDDDPQNTSQEDQSNTQDQSEDQSENQSDNQDQQTSDDRDTQRDTQSDAQRDRSRATRRIQDQDQSADSDDTQESRTRTRFRRSQQDTSANAQNQGESEIDINDRSRTSEGRLLRNRRGQQQDQAADQEQSESDDPSRRDARRQRRTQDDDRFEAEGQVSAERQDVRSLGVRFDEDRSGALTVASAVRSGLLAGSGLRQGDVIVAADGRRITSQDQFRDIILSSRGDELPIVIRRDGRQRTLYVSTQDVRDFGPDAYQDERFESEGAWLGVFLDPRYERQAVVESVQPGSAADDAGLREGDWIVAVNGQDVRSASHLSQLIQRLDPNDVVQLEVSRRVVQTVDARLTDRRQSSSRFSYDDDDGARFDDRVRTRGRFDDEDGLRGRVRDRFDDREFDGSFAPERDRFRGRLNIRDDSDFDADLDRDAGAAFDTTRDATSEAFDGRLDPDSRSTRFGTERSGTDLDAGGALDTGTGIGTGTSTRTGAGSGIRTGTGTGTGTRTGGAGTGGTSGGGTSGGGTSGGGTSGGGTSGGGGQ